MPYAMEGLSEAFDTVYPNILIGKLRKSELDDGTKRWSGKRLNNRVQSIVISGVESS